MSDADPRPHNFNEALRAHGYDLETLREIIAKVKECHEMSGAWPSATQLRALLLRPGL